jgi:hypothetical protein
MEFLLPCIRHNNKELTDGQVPAGAAAAPGKDLRGQIEQCQVYVYPLHLTGYLGELLAGNQVVNPSGDIVGGEKSLDVDILLPSFSLYFHVFLRLVLRFLSSLLCLQIVFLHLRYILFHFPPASPYPYHQQVKCFFLGIFMGLLCSLTEHLLARMDVVESRSNRMMVEARDKDDFQMQNNVYSHIPITFH